LVQLTNANFVYFVADPIGGTTFDGTNYSSLASSSVSFSTVDESANFGGGAVNGSISEFTIVPSPLHPPSSLKAQTLTNVQAVPEPGSVGLIALGMGSLLVWRRLQRARQIKDNKA